MLFLIVRKRRLKNLLNDLDDLNRNFDSIKLKISSFQGKNDLKVYLDPKVY